jgi:hypothetical protein
VEHPTELTKKSLSRQELYDLAWQEPMLRIAERFNVSSSYLARVYTELRVPRPGPGYWAQREFGKAPAQPELPEVREGELTEWNPGAAIGTVVRTTKRARADAAKAADAQAVPAGQATSSQAGTKRGRSRSANDRHELVTGIKQHFAKTRESRNGILRPYKRMLPDLMASPAKLDDVLEAAHLLFTTLNRRGFEVAFAQGRGHTSRIEPDLLESPSDRTHHGTMWSPDRPTVVHIGGTTIGLTLFEMTELVEVIYAGSGEYVAVRDLNAVQLKRLSGPHHWRTNKEFPSGRLCLHAYCPSWRVKWSRRWPESKPGSFEAMVASIVDELETVAPELAKQREQARLQAEEESRRWEEESRRRDIEAERRRVEKARQESTKDLLQSITAWSEAKRVHEFFASVESGLAGLPREEAAALQERLALARSLMGELDPLRRLKEWQSPEEILPSISQYG